MNSSSCNTMCEGDLDELGPLSTTLLLGRLQGHTTLGL
jgi:hypothetical protein